MDSFIFHLYSDYAVFYIWLVHFNYLIFHFLLYLLSLMIKLAQLKGIIIFCKCTKPQAIQAAKEFIKTEID